MTFYLLSTDHLQTKIWFGDDPDYAAAMNFVAIAAHRFGINVLAFILMSNHVHFVLECSKEQALAFISFFKERYGLYRHKRYGDREYLRGNNVDIQEVSTDSESLERVIAYVQCNSVAARLCVHPSGYPWGTGNAFFNAWQMTGRLISSFSGRERVRLLHSKLPVNPEWTVGEGGYILPRSYIKVGFVEGLFRSPSRYQFFLDNSSKAKNSRAHIAPSFSDQLILTASLNLCRSLFRSNRIEDLSPSQTTELVIQLRRRFSSDAAQISRVTGISYAETVRSLESF